jgi:hypothetical protein
MFKTRSHLFSQLEYVFAIIFATFRQILRRKAKVCAKIRKRKLLFLLYSQDCWMLWFYYTAVGILKLLIITPHLLLPTAAVALAVDAAPPLHHSPPLLPLPPPSPLKAAVDPS